VHALLVASKDPVAAEIQAALEDLLVVEVGPPADKGSVAYYRNATFCRLVQLGSKRAVERYARAYELGLRASSHLELTPRLFVPSAQYRGLAWLCTPAKDDPPARLHRVGYDDATAARIFELVLKANHPDAWTDAVGCAKTLDRLPLAVAEKLAELSLDAPETLASGQGVRSAFEHPVLQHLLRSRSARTWWYLQELAKRGRTQLVGGALGGLDPMPAEAKPVLETLLESPDSITVALEGLAKLGATDTVERAIGLLAHEREQVRLGALYTLVNLDKARARREIGALAGDKAWSVRKAFADLAGVLGDEAFVPALLRLLRDDTQPVREAAKASLDRIRFLVEQDAFWAKLKKQGGGDAPSAAEALLEKARKDQPKPTRLMAIDSLGTLGVAETLPFLIDLCSDGDREIAEHAAAAVKRINR
jgi:HEAT repeat protein